MALLVRVTAPQSWAWLLHPNFNAALADLEVKLSESKAKSVVRCLHQRERWRKWEDDICAAKIGPAADERAGGSGKTTSVQPK